MRHRLLTAVLLAASAMAAVACSSSSGGSASPSGDTGASIAPASSSPASEAPPSAAAESEAPASAAPSDTSLAIPSFAFPSTDKELEALLPDTLCGNKVQKLSMGGAVFDNAADPAFVAVLRKLGKTTSDVSFAIAATPSSGDCSAGIFRIKGADGGALKDAFLAEAVTEGSTFKEVSLGGKNVYVDPTSTSFGYAYFKGDAIIFANAGNDKDAADILAALP
jgi:hypothetical protein